MTRATALLLSLAAVLSAALVLEMVAGQDPDDDPPTRLAPPAAADAATAPASGTEGAGDDLGRLTRTILARPLFSPNRRLASHASTAAGDLVFNSLPRLAGVVVAPGGRRAIFAPAEGRPLVVPEGGHIGRYVVRAIMPGQVTLSDAEQQLVVRPSHAKGTPR